MKNLYKIEDELYIISDNENINENDYIITKDDRLVQVSYLLSKDLEGASKVILTTNALLIKYGVQAIDDEFLEWFVKNPSCESVDVNKICNNCGDIDCIHAICRSQIAKTKGDTYKIIIPKEEFSKDEIDKFFVDMVCNPKEESKPFKQMEQLTEVDWEKFKKSPFPSKKVPKQETLTNDTDSHSWGFETFEIIKTEEDAKIFVETMENIPEPNDKLKKAFRDFNKQETLEEAKDRKYPFKKK